MGNNSRIYNRVYARRRRGLDCARDSELDRRYWKRQGRPPIRNMVEVERAYVGAAIDTDGTACLCGKYWRISVTNSELEIISALLRATGTGSVYLRPRENQTLNATKNCWMWSISKQADILVLARQCAPYSTKLQKILVGAGG